MATAAYPRPRKRRQHRELLPLAGRDLDARDIAFVRGVAHNTSASAAIGYDDALSAGLLAYWRAGMRFNPGAASWATYAATIVRHGIEDEARSRDHLSRHHRGQVRRGEVADEPPPASLDLAAHARRSIAACRDEDLRLTVDAALEHVHRIHPRAAAVLRLTYEQDMRDEDIGVLLGCGHSQVSRLRTLGRGLIADLLPLELLDAA